ncbi:MAG TPA: isoprenylcysteine carboxylmethyltransferase family protein [Planctomycetota bacterium]|nr:isoprenylcysteine carboxylmethyltransferase family protein [Planctomycetota bacterium]
MVKSPLRRGGLRTWVVVFALVHGSITNMSVVWGAPAIALGVMLHAWAKGCLRQNNVMAVVGPYRFVRHPFYLANALVDAGVAVMSGWWLLQLVLPLWWLGIYVPVMRREEVRLTSLFGSSYQEYMARVPMLLPWRLPLPSTGGGFSWGNPNLSAGREIPRALRLAAYPLLFLVCSHLLARDWAFFTCDAAWGLSAAVALATLYGLAWECGRALKRRRAILPRPLRAPIIRGLFCIAVILLASLADHSGRWTGLATWRVGLTVLALSVVSFSRARLWTLMAEAATLVGVAALSPWPWLAFAPVLFYAAVILDSRLPPR